VIETYSGDHASGKIYGQDCAPEDWIPVNKVLTVYYSLGLVMVEDFTGKSKSDILAWRDEMNEKGADISLSFLDNVDTVMKKGIITGQSISEELVKPGVVLQVWVSATDNGVLVKNFENMDLEDFKFWCDTNSVPYIVTDCYSDTYEEGKLFDQNYIDSICTYGSKGHQKALLVPF
jgi:beta-lactam-binding protein with PASTA domain